MLRRFASMTLMVADAAGCMERPIPDGELWAELVERTQTNIADNW